MIYYILFINFFSFLCMGIDKWKAIHNSYRLTERFLLCTSFIGGSIGTLLGMVIFHHKIRKIKFLSLMPLFLILNCIYIWLIYH